MDSKILKTIIILTSLLTVCFSAYELDKKQHTDEDMEYFIEESVNNDEMWENNISTDK